MLYTLGRVLQLIALLALPSAIWVGQFGHSEVGAISVFAGSVFVFVLGYIISTNSKK